MPSRAKSGPEITCHCCDGAGKVKLPVVLFRVLQAVEQGHNTSKAVTEYLSDEDVQQTAITNRLNDLTDLGFLSKVKGGKRFVYSKAEQKEAGE